MYQGREGGFEIPYIKPPRDEEWVITLLCWPEFPQEIPAVCDPELEIEGTRLLATQKS